MKLGCRVSMLFLSMAFLAGCGPSQADYDRAKRHSQLVSTERDNLKSQLDQATQKIGTLQEQVKQLQTAATAKPVAEETASKATAKAGSKKKVSRAKARKGKKRTG